MRNIKRREKPFTTEEKMWGAICAMMWILSAFGAFIWQIMFNLELHGTIALLILVLASIPIILVQVTTIFITIKFYSELGKNEEK